ncbi:MAG: hypothetical protein AAGF76_14155 [Pseudomonadota bacterium]
MTKPTETFEDRIRNRYPAEEAERLLEILKQLTERPSIDAVADPLLAFETSIERIGRYSACLLLPLEIEEERRAGEALIRLYEARALDIMRHAVEQMDIIARDAADDLETLQRQRDDAKAA